MNKKFALLKFFSLIFFIFLSIILIYAYIFNYYDIKRNCFIKINVDVLKNNKAKIKESISLVKNNYPQEYEMLCSSVKEVNDQRCFVPSPIYNDPWESYGSCFLKGTHTIFLDTGSVGTQISSNIIMNQILKHSKQAFGWWKNQ